MQKQKQHCNDTEYTHEVWSKNFNGIGYFKGIFSLQLNQIASHTKPHLGM